MKNLIALLSFCLITISCSNFTASSISDGVSFELANERKESYSNLEYKLSFDLPSANLKVVKGDVEIIFDSKKRMPIIVDYVSLYNGVEYVEVNGEQIDIVVENQHIIIPEKYSKKGQNRVKIKFASPSSALNVRSDFVYTLLVPDRARMLFPLFDQPDLKAKYSLSLSVPNNWVGITNSAEISSENLSDGIKKITYNQTEPISSYLFAFAAGEFDFETRERNGKKYHIYHKEKESQKLAQMDDIFNELFHSLDWLENYTGIKYPFSKYDMVLIPSFQYGGMEHIGATFYNSSTMFTSPTPTINEKLNRAKLVAHETAHMWFGDLVTMAWFDDVWTKEVFANFFAAKIVTPLFPEVNEKQTMLNYFSSAYSEDRTEGGTAIKQELDNLKYAGLVYNNIVYNKSPLVLNMIADMLGENAFQMAVSKVLKLYSYDSATWEQWVEIFDEYSDVNITEWAKNWMYANGMPTITIENDGENVVVTQNDPKNRGLLWKQNVSFIAIDEKGNKEEYKVHLDTFKTKIKLENSPKYIIPNSDGMGYGYFIIDDESFEYMLESFSSIESSIERRIALINLYENMINNPEKLAVKFVKALNSIIPKEKDAVIYSTLIGYVGSTYNRYIKYSDDKMQSSLIAEMLDKLFYSEYKNNGNAGMRITAFNALYSNMLSDRTLNFVYNVWSGKEEVEGITLNNDKYMSISYKLALKMPSKADEIVSTQLNRLEDQHLISQYSFISRSVSPKKEEREKLFNELLDEENRGVEKWVQSAISLLMNETHEERNSYIRPALDELSEIQRTGDIFFPAGWCSSLLSGLNYGNNASEIVDEFLNDNPDMQPMLKSKLRIASHHLYYK